MISKPQALSGPGTDSNQQHLPTGAYKPRPPDHTPGRPSCWPCPRRPVRWPCSSAAAEDPWPSRKCFRPAPTWLRPCGLRARCSASRVSGVASAIANARSGPEAAGSSRNGHLGGWGGARAVAAFSDYGREGLYLETQTLSSSLLASALQFALSW